MVATKQQAIALVVVSVLTLAAGIAVMVLFSSLFNLLFAQDTATPLPILSYFWPYGVPVLITGALGLLAAAIKNNVGIGIYMAVCIICLIVEGAFVVIFGLVLVGLLAIPIRDCTDVTGICICTDYSGLSTTTFTLPDGSPCVDPSASILHLTRASCAMIIVSWGLMLAGAIVSCMACCCGKREPGAIIIAPVGTGPGYEMNYPAGGGYAGQPASGYPGHSAGGYGGPPPNQYPAKGY